MIRFIIVSAFFAGILFSGCISPAAFADSFIREELLDIIIERGVDINTDKPVRIPCNQCSYDEQQADCFYVNSISEEKCEKKLNEFFREANIAVSATCEQKEIACQITNQTLQDINIIKKNIKKAKREIAVLEKNCGNKRDIIKQKRNLRKSERELKQVCRNAENEYKDMLTPYQKKSYRIFRRTHKLY